MEQTTNQGARSTVATVAVALVAGVVVLLLLFPSSGVVPIPPQCFSLFGYSVPCDAGAATAAVVGLALWLKSRR